MGPTPAPQTHVWGLQGSHTTTIEILPMRARGSLALILSFWLNPTGLIIKGESWSASAIVEKTGGHLKEFTQHLRVGGTLFTHRQLCLKGSADRASARSLSQLEEAASALSLE